MRNSLSEELRGRIRVGAVQARSGAARIAAGFRSWRWKSLLESPHFHRLSGSSLRGVFKAPKLLLLGLLILQLLVLAVLRSSSSAATAAASSLQQREQPRMSRALHAHAKIRGAADDHADRGESLKSGEFPLPARRSGGESGVLSTALDDAASSVSENPRGGEEQLKIPEISSEDDGISTEEQALLHAGQEEIEEQAQRDDDFQEMPQLDKNIPGKPEIFGDDPENVGRRDEEQVQRDENAQPEVEIDEHRDEDSEEMPKKTPKISKVSSEKRSKKKKKKRQGDHKKITEEQVHRDEDHQADEEMLLKVEKKIPNASSEKRNKQQQEKQQENVEKQNHQEEQQQQQENVEEQQQQQQEEQQQNEETDAESQISASEAAVLEEDPVCKGGRIFIYKLPPKFNSDLVANCSVLNPWTSLCDAFSNGGLGKPMTTTPWPSSTPSPWYYTEQFSGELIFHSRILRHPCVTNDSSSANLFYVPFYAGLDVSRYLWRPSKADERDRLGRELVEWLRDQPAWSRARGRDHFTMIGRITWDFRRTGEKEWGSGLLNLPEMRSMKRLIIEREPWEGGEYGVPYPTSFHPKNEHQLQEWQEFVRTRERGVLFSFAGATRKKFPNDFRLELMAQCSSSRNVCSAMDCSDSRCERPEPVMEMFLNSTFCLQPRGDTYTRRSIFDSMLAGCIPVFFWKQSSYWQYEWFFPEEDESYSVFIDREDVRKGVKIGEVLGRFSDEDVKRMRNGVIDALPRLVYGTEDHELSGADAFDTAIGGVLRSMLRMNVRRSSSGNGRTGIHRSNVR